MGGCLLKEYILRVRVAQEFMGSVELNFHRGSLGRTNVTGGQAKIFFSGSPITVEVLPVSSVNSKVKGNTIIK